MLQLLTRPGKENNIWQKQHEYIQTFSQTWWHPLGKKDKCNFHIKVIIALNVYFDKIVSVCKYKWPELKINSLSREQGLLASLLGDQTICKSNSEINSKPSFYSIM